MNYLYINIFCILLLPLSLIINYTLSKLPQLVERIYSTNLNKLTIEFISNITGFIPFSLYDIFLVLLIIFLAIYIVITIKKCFINKNDIYKIFFKFILNILSVVCVLYFSFIILWGINYNRVPFNESVGINLTNHNDKDLSTLYKFIIDKCNLIRNNINEDSDGIMTIDGGYSSVFNRAIEGYEAVYDKYPTLKGNYSKPKYIISSELFSYTGITGIYFPFTGQANINVNVPLMSIPSTTMHEMAHQRGYAHEDEANFIAYLTCINHPDLDFQYSGYLLALSHVSNALYSSNPQSLKLLNKDISQDVRNDILYRIDFWKKYEGKVNDVSNKINDSYLKSNGVKDGYKSYGRMVDLLLNYYNTSLY